MTRCSRKTSDNFRWWIDFPYYTLNGKANNLLGESKKRIAAKEIWPCSCEGQGEIDGVVYT